MKEIKLNKRAILDIHIEVLTGIHIGGTKDIYGIGGIDSPVIKDPLTGKPIIPGSSIKGKLRSLMELARVVEDAHILFEGNDDGPTRGIFRDFMMTQASSELLQKHLGERTYTEIKAENTIDKFTGKTVRGGLRFIERVPAGAVFEGQIIINAYNQDDLDQFKALLEQGLELLEHNYLGGSGTRGYGKVKVNILSTKEI
jgi:CRISPR-associated protein Csm3